METERGDPEGCGIQSEGENIVNESSECISY